MDIKKIRVRFIDNLTNHNTSKKYNFLTTLEDLKENDLLVVETCHGLALARFVDYVEGEPSMSADKFAMAKVDLSEFEAFYKKTSKDQTVKS